MIPINIYGLTRISDPQDLARMERQLSGRTRLLDIKPWEIDGLRAFCRHLEQMKGFSSFCDFFYSFAIPKLGKEFDLLRVSDSMIINIELKSGNVSDDMIRNQLLKNRYYLSSLCRPIHLFTYISKEDRLVRLNDKDHLADCDFDRLYSLIQKQTSCYQDDLELLFREEDFLISPLSEPKRFLEHEYFLTAQQKDIEKQILKKISEKNSLFFGFTGSPGTGKTLLLYDLAMRLSEKQRVCVLHCGIFPEQLQELNARLKRVDFYPLRDDTGLPELGAFSAILLDEGDKMSSEILPLLKMHAELNRTPVIFAYDTEQYLCPEELAYNRSAEICALDQFQEFRLTNRIRTNAELGSFLNCLLYLRNRNHRKDYPSVQVFYSDSLQETDILLASLMHEGYTIHPQAGMDYEKLALVLDQSWVYGDEGYLQHRKKASVSEFSRKIQNSDACVLRDEIANVRSLYQTLSYAKSKITLVIQENPELFRQILTILQG